MSELTFDPIEATVRVCKRPAFGWNSVVFDTVDSTNNYAKEHLSEITKPTLFLAKHQTAGRGRGQATWEDEGGGKSFLSTWSMKLSHGAPNPRWTLGIGLYLFESLSEAFKYVRFSLKEPNDIFINDKKVAGLLVEGSTQGHVHHLHVGLGINVFSYPTIHSQSATHLSAYMGADQLNEDSWGQFIDYFGTRLIHLEKKATLPNWLGRLSPRLAQALNRHPLHQDNPVQSVASDGSLILARGEINWKEL